jgi:hypothetical protein
MAEAEWVLSNLGVAKLSGGGKLGQVVAGEG